MVVCHFSAHCHSKFNTSLLFVCCYHFIVSSQYAGWCKEQVTTKVHCCRIVFRDISCVWLINKTLCFVQEDISGKMCTFKNNLTECELFFSTRSFSFMLMDAMDGMVKNKEEQVGNKIYCPRCLYKNKNCLATDSCCCLETLKLLPVCSDVSKC